MAIPILGKRRERRQAELADAIEASVEKAIQPAIAMAAQATSGATYPVVSSNPSSPFTQTAGAVPGFQPLPRPLDNFNSGFGPGTPFWPDPLDALGPEGRVMPRRAQYLVSANLQLLDRATPWTMLRWCAEEVDVVNRCIQLVQDGIVGREWSWGYSPSVIEQIMDETGETNHARAMSLARDKYGEELNRVKTFMARPDRRSNHNFSQWMTSLVWQHLVYDGVCIYPQYTLGGDLYALSPIDTSTIKLIIDDQGFPPEPPAPAYQQILYGFPRGEFQASDDPVDGEYERDQLAYYIRRPRPESVYGYPQVEEVLNIATTYLARQAWMRSEYTTGAMPKAFMKTAETENWTPEQLAYYEQIMNDRLSGQIARRQLMFMLRPGMEPVWAPQIDEHFKAEYDFFLLGQIASKFGVPGTQIGVQAKAGLSGGKQMEGEEDQTEHFVFSAMIQFFIDIQNDLVQRFLGVGPEITATCQDAGASEEDLVQQSNADKTVVGFGGITLNDYRADRGLPLYDMPEADEPMIITATGPVFLKGTLAVQDANTETTLNPPPPPKRVMVGPDGKPLPTAPDGSPVPPANNGGAANGNTATPDGNADSGRESVPSGAGSSEGKSDGSAGPGKPGSGSEPSGPGSSTAPTASSKDDGASLDDSGDGKDKSNTAKELAAFAKFARSRTGRGTWRDFGFSHVPAVRAGELNDAGRAGNLELVKALTAQPFAAGLVVKAADTGRVLMVQRAIDNSNKASAGQWEWPGGKLTKGDDALTAAEREWAEEVGVPVPDGDIVGSWTTPDGRYQAFVLVIKHESDIELDDARGLDGSGDGEVENVAWWEPNDIVGNSAVRIECQSSDWSLLGHAKSLPLTPMVASTELVSPGVNITKAADAVADRIRGDIDRLRQSYGLLTEVREFVKTAPSVINVNVPTQPVPDVHLHAEFKPRVEVDATSTHKHQHDVRIDAPIDLKPEIAVDATSTHHHQHENHINVEPTQVHVEPTPVTVAPEIHVEPTPVNVKVPKADVHVHVPEQQRHSTVKRNPDGTVSIEHDSA